MVVVFDNGNDFAEEELWLCGAAVENSSPRGRSVGGLPPLPPRRPGCVRRGSPSSPAVVSGRAREGVFPAWPLLTRSLCRDRPGLVSGLVHPFRARTRARGYGRERRGRIDLSPGLSGHTCAFFSGRREVPARNFEELADCTAGLWFPEQLRNFSRSPPPLPLPRTILLLRLV